MQIARHRTSNTSIIRDGGFPVTVKTSGSTPEAPVTVTTSYLNGGRVGEFGVCDDCVTVGLRKRIAEGEVINNPFTSIRSKLTFGGSGPLVLYTGSWAPYTMLSTEYSHANTHYVPEYDISDYWATDPYVLSGLLPASAKDAVAAAKTSALSRVDTSYAAVLTSLGELNATFKMLLNPLSAARSYISRFKWQTKRKGKTVYLTVDQGAGLLPTTASQYLEFYYGLLPFLRDIESILDAYIKSGYQPLRETARGGESDTDVRVYEWYTGTYPVQDGRTWYRQRKTVTTKWDARAGILYEPSKLDWRKAYGFRAGDVLPALWDLTPWSFFLDYFGNFSKLIGAMSPRSGIEYLACWEGCRVTRTVRVECIDSGMGGTRYYLERKGSEWAQCEDSLHYRLPVSPYSGLGFQLSLGNWESKAKILAVASLAVQQLAKLPVLQAGKA